MDIISKRTRVDFREYLVGVVLREITIYFENHGVRLHDQPQDKTITGERRNLVEQYYADIDWKSHNDVIKIIRVYEEILSDINDQQNDIAFVSNLDRYLELQRTFQKLIKDLKKDGFDYQNGKLVSAQLQKNLHSFGSSVQFLDKEHFQEYTDRIQQSVESDPRLAIGSTKELLEAVMKTILTERQVAFSKNDDIPKLLKMVQSELELLPSQIDDAKRGADTIRVILSSLGSIVIKITELRNLYGTGHGTGGKRSGLNARHARLTVGAGITLATFLLETYELKASNNVP